MIKSNIKSITYIHGSQTIAKFLGVSESSIQNYIRKGYVNSKRIERLAELDSNFTVDDFKQDIKKNYGVIK